MIKLVARAVELILRRMVALTFGLLFIFLGLEPIVTPPWEPYIHTGIWFWFLFPLPIPYLGNLFWFLVGVGLLIYMVVGDNN